MDGLTRRSPPAVLTVPSATGNIRVSPCIGVPRNELDKTFKPN